MIVRYHSLAKREVIEAAIFYEKERDGLGAEFLDELDKAERMIAGNPELFEEVRPGIRRCLVERFPYGVYYRTPDVHTVQIVIVKHHRRRPGLGMRRK
jgi:plasmid stabilization system protein ParE